MAGPEVREDDHRCTEVLPFDVEKDWPGRRYASGLGQAQVREFVRDVLRSGEAVRVHKTSQANLVRGSVVALDGQ